MQAVEEGRGGRGGGSTSHRCPCGRGTSRSEVRTGAVRRLARRGRYSAEEACENRFAEEGETPAYVESEDEETGRLARVQGARKSSHCGHGGIPRTEARAAEGKGEGHSAVVEDVLHCARRAVDVLLQGRSG